MLDGGGGRTQKDVYFPPSILVVRGGLKTFCLSSHFVSSAALVMTRGRHSGRYRDASAGSCRPPNKEWRHWLFKRSLDVVNWRQHPICIVYFIYVSIIARMIMPCQPKKSKNNCSEWYILSCFVSFFASQAGGACWVAHARRGRERQNVLSRWAPKQQKSLQHQKKSLDF